jgi:RNA polymerase sigma-70 factor, ECF subfamily
LKGLARGGEWMEEVPTIRAFEIGVTTRPADSDAAIDFDYLYATRAAQVAAWARRLGGPTIDVDDIVQEVFLVVHRRLPRLRQLKQLTGWLFRLTENMVRHQIRTRRWSKREETNCELPADRPSPHQSLESREAEARLYRCLEKLRDRYRVPLILFEIEGLPASRIAELLGISVPAVWTRVRRGRQQLLCRLQNLDAEELRRGGLGTP